MDAIFKSALLEKAEISEIELALINQQTMRTLTADEVFTFRLAACDNQIDRDGERFTDETLAGFVPLFVGRPVLMDHKWSAAMQTARVYAAEVEKTGEVQRLVLRCYMPRSETSAPTILAIESGILRECSVGVQVKDAICSICGTKQREAWCKHCPGVEYDGKLCVMELTGAADAYEVSLVAVPAQPNAGIVKSKRYGGPNEPTPGDPAGGKPEQHSEDWQADAELELEKNRF